MFSLIAFVLNAKFIVGLVLGSLATLGYFSYTGSTINWKRKK